MERDPLLLVRYLLILQSLGRQSLDDIDFTTRQGNGVKSRRSERNL